MGFRFPPSEAAQALNEMDPMDGTESDDEGIDGYRKGGYHVVNPGEVYNKGRYLVLDKLGWGHFSTVWLCQDLQWKNVFCAMKVHKSAPHYTEAAYDEIELLAQAARGSGSWDASQYLDLLGGRENKFTGVVQLIDYFEHEGPNGKHVCMVFETMGPNVLALIKRYSFKGVPLDIVRKVAAHTLIGLDYLHRVCGIIHTDLKPENVLVSCPRGVPVDKIGVPKVALMMGIIDNDALIAKKQSVAQNMMQQVRKKPSKAEKKKKNKLKREEEAAARDIVNEGKTLEIKQEGDTTEPDPEAASQEAAAGTGAAQKPMNSPPYMVPYLKPTRSDPSLLSSYHPYGDTSSLLKRPYHHKLEGLLEADAEASKAYFGSNGKARGSSEACSKAPFDDEALLKEVMSLDLFSHDTVTYKVADLGNACWTTKHFSDDIQTRQYRGPETIINAGYDTSADVWSLGCMIFELVTGDYLFDPKASEEYPRDEDHLALFQELLGEIPHDLIRRGRRSSTYFNRRSELRHIKTFRYWGLEDVLEQKYYMHRIEAINLSSFLNPMLMLHPSDRSTAQNLLKHPWLRGLPSPEAAAFVSQMGVPPPISVTHADGRDRGDEEDHGSWPSGR